MRPTVRVRGRGPRGCRVEAWDAIRGATSASPLRFSEILHVKPRTDNRQDRHEHNGRSGCRESDVLPAEQVIHYELGRDLGCHTRTTVGERDDEVIAFDETDREEDYCGDD